MDTSRFTDTRDRFPLLDLTAAFAWKTASSICFDLGRVEDIHPENDPTFVVKAFNVHGWAEVHHPCLGTNIPVRVTVCLPAVYHDYARTLMIVNILRKTLAI